MSASSAFSSPGRPGGVGNRDRAAMASMTTRLAADEGDVTGALIALRRMRAAGCAGLIVAWTAARDEGPAARALAPKLEP